MPLAIADKGVEFIIKRIGGNAEIKRHLGNLGFVVGATISVINEFNGNIIVSIKDSRVAISKAVANKIYI